jgi:hypothetical protein
MNDNEIEYYGNQILRRLGHPNFLDKWTEVNDDQVTFYFKIDGEQTLNCPLTMKRHVVETEIQNNQLFDSLIVGLKEIFLKLYDVDISDLKFSDYYE